jgi:histidine phosphotransferase ChpT
MTEPISLGELELAALMCSRVCHDLISPVGAIVNGLEILDDDADEETRDVAWGLIRKSAEQASDSLQFARLAFGAAGSAGAMLEMTELERIARGHAESDRLTLEWTAPASLVARDAGRLMLNLVLTAIAALPRGGRIALTVDGDGAVPSYRLRCSGNGARVPAEAEALIRGEANGAAVDARSIQPYFTGLLAQTVGMEISIAMAGEDVEIVAHP